MTTRGYRSAPAHVEALCAVEVEFHDSEQDRKVRDVWKHYRNHLNLPAPPASDDSEDKAAKAASEAFYAARENGFVALLYEIGKAIGKEYSLQELKDAYLPSIWYETEIENQLLRRGLLNVLNAGVAQSVIPVGVKYELAVQPTAAPPTVAEESAPVAKEVEQRK